MRVYLAVVESGEDRSKKVLGVFAEMEPARATVAAELSYYDEGSVEVWELGGDYITEYGVPTPSPERASVPRRQPTPEELKHSTHYGSVSVDPLRRG